MNKYPYMKAIKISLFKYIDPELTGSYTFTSLLKATYPNLMKKQQNLEIIKTWIAEYNEVHNRYRTDENLENLEIKHKVPLHGIQKLNKVFKGIDTKDRGRVSWE